MLAFVTGSVDTSGVVVLHYLGDFLVIGYGKAKVGSVSQRLCDALRKAGAVISTKSVLEPVPEIQWLGKWLVLSGNGAGVFPKGQGGGAAGAAPYPQTRPSYPGPLYLEPAPGSGVRPFFEWLVGPLSVGAELASELPPVLGPEPPALPPAFL